MTEDAPIDDWQYRIIKYDKNPINIMLGSGLRKIEIRDSENATCGYMIGFPISLKNKLFLMNSYNSVFNAKEQFESFIDEIFINTAGKYLLILDIGDLCRIYPDAAAQIPCVYDKDARIAASTAHALLNAKEYEKRLDNEILRQFSINKKGWLPAGLTAHSGIRRLLPNHYLDLISWDIVRFWPKGSFKMNPTVDEVYDEMREIIITQEEAMLSSGYNIYQGLTAGVDSRFVLGAALPMKKRIKYITIGDISNKSLDQRIAGVISRKIGSDFIEIKMIKSTSEERNLFIRRGGHCIAETNSYIYKSLSAIPRDSVYVSGVGGEVARGYYYSTRNKIDVNLNSRKILLYAEIPECANSMSAVDQWLSGIPNFLDRYQTLDLFYIENRLGSWASPQFCCDPTIIRISPIICRRMFEIFLSIDVHSKMDGAFLKSAINYYNIEIGKMRYNSAGFLPGVLEKFMRAARDPEKLIRKIRKLVS